MGLMESREINSPSRDENQLHAADVEKNAKENINNLQFEIRI